MNVVVTGGSGFVGLALVRRLLADGVGGRAVTALTSIDMRFDGAATDPRLRRLQGSVADTGLLEQAFAQPVDVLFHLASVPGGAAEQDFALGLSVNLQATMALLECCRAQAQGQGGTPVLVYSSSIAVYGAPLPAHIDDDTPMRPHLSYGAHKLACEVLIQDYSRRGWLDGRILRLPGIVARPPAPSGLLSAFMSDIFWRLKDGERFTCPVSAQAVAWWMSLGCCVDNLLHGAVMAPAQADERRDYTLPVLRLTIAEVVDGLAMEFGDDRRALVEYRPDDRLEQGFGRQPPLDASAAERAGFHHDGDLRRLIVNAVAPGGAV
ncbi:NAD-dependent epimerase/dehydratase family protein [Oxalobacteraceae bacterium OTU3REALA1]|nr:NAD-dependent epimerase/dehydratase family protein [Oxalobacteraceae bacterium OTU3REALA1]